MDFQNIADMFLCVKEYRQKSSAECNDIMQISNIKNSLGTELTNNGIPHMASGFIKPLGRVSMGDRREFWLKLI